MKWITLLAFLFATATAVAHDIALDIPKNSQWQEECGSCHIAYPPQFLTADNWQRMMSGLDRHFGANAGLDAASNEIITSFLKRYAGTGVQHQARTLRISDTPWFKREHDEIPVGAWADPAIKSPANCTACHIGAEQGDWSEDSVLVPDGLGEEKDDGDEHDEDEDED